MGEGIITKLQNRCTSKMAKRTTEITITESCGNVFADLGFKNADEMLAKADLVIAMGEVIKSRKFTQAEVAKLIGIDQPQVSKLLRGQTIGYTTDRLVRILNRLGQDVTITVSPKPAKARREAGVFVVQSRKAAVVNEKKAAYGKKAAKPKITR